MAARPRRIPAGETLDAVIDRVRLADIGAASGWNIGSDTRNAAVLPAPLAEELWAAARAGDVARVTAALDKGADVNAKTRYGATALTYAADKGHLEIVKLLIARGADVNAQDSFYQMRAVDMAMTNNHPAVVTLLLERGSKGAPDVLPQAIQRGNVALVAVALESPELTRAHVRTGARGRQKGQQPGDHRADREEARGDAGRAGRRRRRRRSRDAAVVRRQLSQRGGRRRDHRRAERRPADVDASGGNAAPMTLIAISPTSFRVAEREGLTINFEGRGGMIERVVAVLGTRRRCGRASPRRQPERLRRPAPRAGSRAAAPAAADTKPAARTAARNWPGFRGENAAGNGDGQGAVVEWDVDTQQNIRWKTAIPGISNASPVVWGNRVFIVTAVSSAGDKTFRTGLYGDVAPVNDLSEHTWKIYCLDKATGKILWERDAFNGVPKVKRHTKSSQANSTPATDGRRVVAMFGSIGMLAAWDMDGKPLWKTDIGVLDSGWFFDPDTQWGHSSSPIIHGDKVIVQADRYKDSFIAAYNVGDREAGLAHRARRDLDLGNADRVPRRQPRADRHQRTEDPRLRPGHRQAALDARPELRSHRRHAGRRQRRHLRHRRISAGAARLRDQAERQRRHLAAEGQDVERSHRLEQQRRHLHPDADLLRRHSVYLRQQRRRHRLRRRRPASASTARALAAAARSRHRPIAADGRLTSPTKTGTSSSRAPAARIRRSRRTR